MLQAIVFADGALEAKSARDCGEKQNVEELMKRTDGEPNDQKSDKSAYNDKHDSF